MSVAYLYGCHRCREPFIGVPAPVVVEGCLRFMCDPCAKVTEDEKYRAAMEFFGSLSDEEAEA